MHLVDFLFPNIVCSLIDAGIRKKLFEVDMLSGMKTSSNHLPKHKWEKGKVLKCYLLSQLDLCGGKAASLVTTRFLILPVNSMAFDIQNYTIKYKNIHMHYIYHRYFIFWIQGKLEYCLLVMTEMFYLFHILLYSVCTSKSLNLFFLLPKNFTDFRIVFIMDFMASHTKDR